MGKKRLTRSGLVARALEQRADLPPGEDVSDPYYPNTGRKNQKLGTRTFDDFEADQARGGRHG